MVLFVQNLLREGAEINVRDTDGLTPLQMAAIYGSEDVVNSLIGSGADVNAVDSSGNTPLHWAAHKGHQGLVATLRKVANTALRDHNNRTALHLAAIAGTAEVVQLLLTRSDVEAKDRSGRTPLHLAAAKGHHDVVAQLLAVEPGTGKAGRATRARDNEGQTPLHLAAANGHVTVARLIAMAKKEEGEGEEEEDARDKEGRTPLHLAAANGYEDIARLLVEFGANMNATALAIRAVGGGAVAGKVTVVGKMVHLPRWSAEGGLVVGGGIAHGGTAYSASAYIIFDHSCKMGAMTANCGFLEAGEVDDNGFIGVTKNGGGSAEAEGMTAKIPDGDGGPAHVSLAVGMPVLGGLARLSLSQEGGNAQGWEIDLDPLEGQGQGEARQGRRPVPVGLAIGGLAQQSGPACPSEATGGRTPLHMAAVNGCAAVVRLLLEKGADKEARSFGEQALGGQAVGGPALGGQLGGRTPLHLAAERGHGQVADLLVRGGANLEAKDDNGRTPLHLAAENGQLNVAALLVNAGANQEAEEHSGWTPLYWAATRGNLAIADLLVKSARANTTAKRSKMGETPLHWAAKEGHISIVKLLVEHTDKEAPDAHGLTPRDWATFWGQDAIAKLL